MGQVVEYLDNSKYGILTERDDKNWAFAKQLQLICHIDTVFEMFDKCCPLFEPEATAQFRTKCKTFGESSLDWMFCRVPSSRHLNRKRCFLDILLLLNFFNYSENSSNNVQYYKILER